MGIMVFSPGLCLSRWNCGVLSKGHVFPCRGHSPRSGDCSQIFSLYVGLTGHSFSSWEQTPESVVSALSQSAHQGDFWNSQQARTKMVTKLSWTPEKIVTKA